MIWRLFTGTKIERPADAKERLFSVAGESFENDDGTSRQSIIRRCKEGDRLRLVHEPNNQYDEKAIRVIAGKGQVGYVTRGTNRWVLSAIRTGQLIDAEIHAINISDGGYCGVVGKVYLKPK